MNISTEDKRKHLEMIQNIINRMASNSFVFKGWSITIIAGISTFAAKDSNLSLIFIPFISTLLFWGVDAYYLMMERSFRDYYKTVAKKPSDKIDFLMTPKGIGFKEWFVTLRRPILVSFYGIVLVMLATLYFILRSLNHGS